MSAKKSTTRVTAKKKKKAATAKPGGKPTSESSVTPDDTAKPQEADEAVQAGPPVVGIGASAGGLDAFKKFLSAMPDDSGMALILVQHLDPDHESLMVDLLSVCTNMRVLQAENRMPVQANHVYVIPPNKYLTIHDGALHLTAPTERRGMRVPIDCFLRSLAQDRQERAIGVILSGTGSEGAQGLKDIKERGGMAMVQDPLSAAYDGMPRNAIATGMVDYVLPVEKMPEKLLKYVGQLFKHGATDAASAEGDGSARIHEILELLAARTGHDFWSYKKGTVLRRVTRRMNLCHIEETGDYVQYLHDNPAEVGLLRKDLLIGVSSFFRDPAAFKVLETKVIPRLLEQQDAKGVLRIWTPGCSTGEEAYSLAMLLAEQTTDAGKACNVQIFATDPDVDALEVGRGGVYPEGIVTGVTSERLHRFFTKKENAYHVHPALREMIFFSQQNLITDTPFSKMDLVTCRNVLIYLESEVQERIISLFHFALRESGFLFLGNAETVGRLDDLFQPLSPQWRIYTRIGPSRRWRTDFPIVRVGERGVAHPVDAVPASPQPAQVMHKALLDEFAPASVLVNSKGMVMYIHGALGPYLDLPEGEPTNDVLAMAYGGLRAKLRNALFRAVRGHEAVIAPGARVKRDGAYHPVRITVKPVEGDGLYLVAFEPEPPPAAVTPPDAVDGGDSALAQLEYELESTREDLHGVIAEMEVTQEELKASNEEMMSLNEEFQSTNEELETSKEELQSLNEELRTVNNQLQIKIDELQSTNNDLSNLLTSTDIATIFLDKDFRIRRYAPSATNLLNIIPGDIGRPISDIAGRFTKQTLLKDARQVFESLTPLSRELRTVDGQWYLCRVLPYRTLDRRIDGVVITYSDIDRLKRTEAELNQLNDTLEHRVIERTDARDLAQLELNVAQREIIEIATLEHRRIGQELHDNLGQQMTGVCLLAKSLHKCLAAKELPLTGKAEKLLNDVQAMTQTVHNLARGLWPVEVEPKDFCVALETLVETVSKESGIPVAFECARSPVLDSDLIAASLYGIAREALANAVKHAKAKNLTLAVLQSNGDLTLQVRDDGTGIPVGAKRDAGMGLHIMRYRASVVGAKLTIDTAPGGGTLVSCTVDQSERSSV